MRSWWKTFRWILAALLVAWVVDYVWHMNSRGLSSYAKGFFESAGVQTSPAGCEMVGYTRVGYCKFKLSSGDFQALVLSLGLYEVGRDKTYDGTDIDTECIRTAGSSAVPYKAHQPPPPMPGNVTSSFIRLWYDKETGETCLDLQYPFG